jgi:hypothetical protein
VRVGRSCLPLRLSTVAQSASHRFMDEIARTHSSESSPADAGRWIGRVIIAVILAEGIWGFIVSVTNNLVLPLLARTMGGDVQSPLYLGKGEFNVPALFTSVLELCFVGIAAVVLNSWVQRNPGGTRSRTARVRPIAIEPPAPPPSPPALAPVPAAVSAASPVTAPRAAAALSPVTQPPDQFWSRPEASSQPQAAAPPPPTAKPAKPKPPKQIYYNIAGEPVTPEDDE